MKFETEAFISYTHLDDQGARQGHKWVTEFHHFLGIRLGQLLGKPALIWRDPKLQGNEALSEKLLELLKHAAVLVPVVSPRYLLSEWARRELQEFCHAASETGGVEIGLKTRLFKVVKTPVPREQEPPELEAVLGYEFFTLDPNTGRPRELDDPGDKEYWTKLEDVAYDIRQLLQLLESDQPFAPGKKTVYLAETTFDLKSEREAMKRDLQQHGHTVLPSRPLPLEQSALVPFVRDQMALCDVAVLMVGKTFSLIPEGGKQSLLEVQNQLGIERAEKSDFVRLVWIPTGLQVLDERQQKFIEQLRLHPGLQKGADLLETSLEDLKTLLHDRLKPAETPKPRLQQIAAPAKGLTQIYFIFDRQDREAIAPWADFLFEQGLEVIRSVFEGDEKEIREFHEENLRTCDVVLIHFGEGNEMWLRGKLRDLQRCTAYGRTQPPPVIWVSIAPPITPQKELFRTHEAIVIPQTHGFAPEEFRQVLASLKAD